MKNNDPKTPREKLEDLIGKMAINHNFWGYIFGRLQKIEYDGLPSIMGVGLTKNNTVSLFFNPKLIPNTNDDTIELVLEHEGLHLLNRHISRSLRYFSLEIDQDIEQKKRMLWNYATDCAVNTQMNMPYKVEINGEAVTTLKPSLYGLPEDRTSESYYETFLEMSKDQCVVCGSNQDESQQQSGQGSGENENNNSSENQDTKDDQNQNGNGSESNSDITIETKCPCCGKTLKKENYNIDDHSNWDNSNDETSNSEDVARKVEDQVKDITRKAVKSFSSNRDRGTLPGYLQELIDELLDVPKVPYYQIIRSLVKGSRLSKWKKAYTRINKKRVYTFFDSNQSYITPMISPFPGRTRDFTFHIVILIDTSMSQSAYDIAEALSGVKDIIENDKYCKTTVIENDTRIGKEYEVKKVSDINFEVSGRGGTILRPGILRARELNPDIMLGFTDGYCDDINSFPDPELPKKIIWCVSPGGTDSTLNKTGPVVFLDDD